jgi:hypothetical protein
MVSPSRRAPVMKITHGWSPVPTNVWRVQRAVDEVPGAAETANSLRDRESSAARVPRRVMARWPFISSSAAHPSPGAPRA